MKKTILGSIIASLLILAPTASFASNVATPDNSIVPTSTAKSVKNTEQHSENLSTPELKKKIAKDIIELKKIRNEVDNFFEKRKSLGAKLTNEQKQVIVSKLMDKLEFYPLPEIDENKYPEDLVKAYKINEETYRHILQDTLTAVLQQTFDEGDTGIEFKTSGERHQTLMVITPAGGNHPKMTVNHFPEILKVSLLMVGFEDVLFTNFQDDTRLVPIRIDTEEATDALPEEKSK